MMERSRRALVIVGVVIAYLAASAGTLGAALAASSLNLKPLAEVIVRIVPKHPRGGLFESYGLPDHVWHPWVAILTWIMLAGVTALIHLAIAAAFERLFRWREHPPYWTDVIENPALSRGIVSKVILRSSWRAAFALPVAYFTWHMLAMISEAAAGQFPYVIAPAWIARWTLLAFVLLVYGYSTGAAFRRAISISVDHEHVRCPKCGYLLVGIGSQPCPECGLRNPRTFPVDVSIRGFPLFPGRLRSAAVWTGVACLMLIAPLLLPAIGLV